MRLGRNWALLSVAASLSSAAYSVWLYSALPERWLRWVFTLLSKPDGDSPPFNLTDWVAGELSWFMLGQVLLLAVATIASVRSRPLAIKTACLLITFCAAAWALYVGDFAFGTRADLVLSEDFKFSP